MSERLFAGLLSLYPAQFRHEYGAECVQMVRDRMRDERGLLAKTRLWFDLILDCAVGVPRLHSAARADCTPVGAGSARSFMFWMEEERTIRPVFVGCASLVSLAVFGCLLLWMGLVRQQREIALSEALRAQPRVTKFHPHAEEGGALQSENASYDSNPRARILRAAFVIRPHGGMLGGTAAGGTGQPLVEDATKAMVRAFQTHSIVLFGETHANKQEYAWLCGLVKNRAFHARVDDIVVEFGNSLYQKSVDSYIAGENVPFEQVEKAWRNVAGAVGPVSPVYGEFYEAVRASNQRYPKHKIRLVLGDPYVDWSKIKDAEDLGPFVAHREEWYAQVVKDEVLAKGHRALLIMGAGHFRRFNVPGMIERTIRAAGVDPYLVVFGTNVVGGYDDVDPRFDSWKTPAIVSLAGNWVGDLPAMPVLTCGAAAPNGLKMSAAADAMFYAGPRDTLTQVNVPAEELENTEYGREVNRRLMIEMGRTMAFTEPSEMPQCRRPARQAIVNGPIGPPPPPMPHSMHDPLPPRPPSQ
jgi:hypothetical protein